MAEVEDGGSKEGEGASGASTPSRSNAPVERKKNASGRRKLTPHPLNPNNASTAALDPLPVRYKGPSKIRLLQSFELLWIH